MPESVRPSVFAVEDTSAQLIWPAGRDGRSQPEALDVAGLPPDADHVVAGTAVRTLAPPPGPELFRFATVNDMHVGDRQFSFLGHMVQPLMRLGPANFARDCAAAAMEEAVAWGAQL